jgi:lysozyme
LLKKLNAGDIEGAAKEFLKWNLAAGKVMAGLTKRRSGEMAEFLLGADFTQQQRAA